MLFAFMVQYTGMDPSDSNALARFCTPPHVAPTPGCARLDLCINFRMLTGAGAESRDITLGADKLNSDKAALDAATRNTLVLKKGTTSLSLPSRRREKILSVSGAA